jgi:hypothetical protein
MTLMGDETGDLPSAPEHAALFASLRDASRFISLPGDLDDDGYAILEDVYVGQTVEAIQFSQANPEWGPFRPAVPCRALIDTGAYGCAMTRTLADGLDLKPVPGTDRVTVRQQMADGTSRGYELAYPAGVTIGGGFYKQIHAPANLSPARDDDGQDRYEILLGGDFLKCCVLLYDGHFGKNFTLYVPKNIPRLNDDASSPVRLR